MQLRSEIQIASMMKALKDVVIPAIDPVNRLAIEQSQLILGMLNLMVQQLPLQFRFDRDELQRLLACASQLSALPATGGVLREAQATLAECQSLGADVLARCTVDPAELTEVVRALRAATGSLMSAASEAGDPATLRAAEDAVLALSREQLLRDRALVIRQGWEPDPAALPSIESLLAG